MPEITVDLSRQSIDLLKQLERWGIYGFDVSDIAGRMIDKCLIDLYERGLVKFTKKEVNDAEVQKEASSDRRLSVAAQRR